MDHVFTAADDAHLYELLDKQLRAAVFDRLPKIEGVTFIPLKDLETPVRVAIKNSTIYIHLCPDGGFKLGGQFCPTLDDVIAAVRKRAAIEPADKAYYDKTRLAYLQLLSDLPRLGEKVEVRSRER